MLRILNTGVDLKIPYCKGSSLESCAESFTNNLKLKSAQTASRQKRQNDPRRFFRAKLWKKKRLVSK